MHGLTSSPTWLLKSQQHEQGKVDDHFAIEHEQLQCRKCMKMQCFNVFCLSFSHPRMGMSASEAQVGLFLCKSLFASGGVRHNVSQISTLSRHVILSEPWQKSLRCKCCRATMSCATSATMSTLAVQNVPQCAECQCLRS